MTNKEDEFKSLVDDIFNALEQKPKMILADLDDGSLLDLDEDSLSFCIDKINLELSETRDAFIDFQNSLSHLAISEFLSPAIENFAEFASSLAALFHGDLDSIDVDSLSYVELKKLEHLKKLRNQVLSDIYLKYK